MNEQLALLRLYHSCATSKIVGLSEAFSPSIFTIITESLSGTALFDIINRMARRSTALLGDFLCRIIPVKIV